MLLTVNKVNEVLSGVLGNLKYSIPFNSDVYVALLRLEELFDVVDTPANAKILIEQATELVKGAEIKKAMEAFGDSLMFDSAKQKYYLISNNVVSSIPLPKVLADKIVEATEKGLSAQPLIKAWTWFLKNPKFNMTKAKHFAEYITNTYVDDQVRKDLIEAGYTYEIATQMATYNDVAITKNGLLSTYKYAQIKYKVYNEQGELIDRYASTFDPESGQGTVQLPENAEDYYLIPPIMGEGGDAFFAGETLGHRIVVGQAHVLDSWDKVDTTDGAFARKGLHLGGQAYIKGYGGHSRLLLNCFVNPMNIARFDHSGNGAVVVKEYFVHSAEFAPNKAMYHESSYLERSKEQWTEMRAEGIKNSEEAIKALKAKQDELNAL
jgi:hypothetical protein